MKLRGQQYQKFAEALIAAFPTQNKLAQMLQYRLAKHLAAIAGGDNLSDIAFSLIQTANAEGWVDQLLRSARESNPGNPELLEFARDFGLAPQKTPESSELERIIKSTNSFLDLSAWRSRLGVIEGRVCKFEIKNKQGTGYGTGFLVGPDLVITNYHVLEAVIQKMVKSSDVVMRFDYKHSIDGKIINTGTEYRLASDWLVDSSPYSPLDLQIDRLANPDPDHLDYALVRVDGKPGNEPIGASGEPNAATRGWLTGLSNYDFPIDGALFIVQHPDGQPLKLALDTNAIIAVNGNKTRVTYRTNTEGGSSGSPCFTQNWELVALHHCGDPNFASAYRPNYNQGIPFSRIIERLARPGLGIKLPPAPT